MLVDPESVHPRRRAAQRLEPLRIGGQADVSDGVEPGGVTGLLLEAFVKVAGVAAQEQRGLVRHPRRGDQPGGVPGGACGEFMLLEQHDVGPAQVRQVVGDAAAGHAATDDHRARPVGKSLSLLTGGTPRASSPTRRSGV